ncbi:MAG: hypothetical protein ACI9C4_002073 [Paraglaciecola sp.]
MNYTGINRQVELAAKGELKTGRLWQRFSTRHRAANCYSFCATKQKSGKYPTGSPIVTTAWVVTAPTVNIFDPVFAH